jgi:major membrane immunogen (membrane-anchored lipoprotein)
MSLNKPLILLSMISSLMLLGACGNDDSATTSAEGSATAMVESTPAPASEEGMAISMDSIEKAEGVVYQDEIYAKWPK